MSIAVVPRRISLPIIEYAPPGGATAGDDGGCVFAVAGQGSAYLFAVVQGISFDDARSFFARLRETELADRGTPAARILRAATRACRSLEQRTSGRLELAGFGFTALRMERDIATFAQLLPSQA